MIERDFTFLVPGGGEKVKVSALMTGFAVLVRIFSVY
jgi:hypothetical protein